MPVRNYRKWLLPFTVAFPLIALEAAETFAQQDTPAGFNSVVKPKKHRSQLSMTDAIRKAYELNSLKKVDEAIKLLNQLITQFPRNTRPLAVAGHIMRANTSYAEALEYYNRAISVIENPMQKDWNIFYSRGVCYERLGQWSKAEVDLLKAMELDPDQPNVLNYLGYSWVDQNINLDKAIQIIRKAARLKPEDSYILDSFGWANYRLGNYTEAVKLLEQAVKLAPNDAIITSHFGYTLLKTDRAKEAACVWRKTLDLNPTLKLKEMLETELASSPLSLMSKIYCREKTVAQLLGGENGNSKPNLMLDDLKYELQRLYQQKKYQKAADVARRALKMTERQFGPDQLATAKIRDDLAELYKIQDRDADAETLFRRSLAIREKTLGPEYPRIATTLNQLALLYVKLGRYGEAEPLFKRALKIDKKALGPGHPKIVTTLYSLASLYWRQYRYADAALAKERGLEIAEKILTPNHPELGSALNQLAELYRIIGRYSEAEPFYKRALAIREKLGLDHQSVGSTLNNLALLYLEQDRYDEAEPLFKRSLAIREKASEPDNVSTAITLNNLAELYREQSRYEEALPHYQRSLKIRLKLRGPDHPDVAISLNNIALTFKSAGFFKEAEPLYKRSLTIVEEALGSKHRRVATALMNLAHLHYAQGHFQQAEPLYKRALAIRGMALGKDHPNVGRSLNSLASLYESQSGWKRATEYYRRGTTVITRRMRRRNQIIGQSRTGERKSEAARSSFVFKQFVKSAYRLARRNDKASAKLAAEMFQAAQWAAGSEAAASLAKMAARQATGNSQLAQLVRERQDLVGEWQKRDEGRSATVAQHPSKRNKQAETRNVARLTTIDKRIAEIDQRLAVDFPDYASLANPTPLKFADVQKQLKANEALVLFLDTKTSKPTPEETFIWVVTKTASRWVRSDLGSEALRDHVDALRCGLDFDGAWKGSRCFDLLNVVYTDADRRQGKPLPFELSRAHKLYTSLFGEVADLIKGKDLLIVPSGPLTQLPFQVLVTEKPEQEQLTRTAFRKASWLAKHHAITVLPSVSSLKALRAHAKTSTAKKPFVGFGNPLLDGDKGNRWHRDAAKQARSIKGCAAAKKPVRTAQLRVARQAVMPMGRGARLADLAQIRSAAALPETADEVCDVGRAAGASNDEIYLGDRATEAGLKALSEQGVLARYKVVHFATHGALAGELTGSNEPGLILSPPATATANDDGYLSASEVAGLKLDADWVILSACNTAGSGASSAEALSGLARAFFYAGARSLLVSHWYVDSQATVALITKAFDELKRNPKVGRAGALRTAMLSLIQDDERTWHPAYWAPFVVVGEGSAPVQSVAVQSADQVPPLPRHEKSRARTATVVPRTAVAKSVKKRRKRPKVIRRKRSRKQTSPPAPNWAEQYFQK